MAQKRKKIRQKTDYWRRVALKIHEIIVYSRNHLGNKMSRSFGRHFSEPRYSFSNCFQLVLSRTLSTVSSWFYQEFLYCAMAHNFYMILSSWLYARHQLRTSTRFSGEQHRDQVLSVLWQCCFHYCNLSSLHLVFKYNFYTTHLPQWPCFSKSNEQ